MRTFVICAKGRRVWLRLKRQGSIGWKEGSIVVQDGDIIHFCLVSRNPGRDEEGRS
jgi:hypothetical protein